MPLYMSPYHVAFLRKTLLSQLGTHRVILWEYLGSRRHEAWSYSLDYSVPP